MPIGATAAAVGGSVLSSVVGAASASSAAKAQAKAAKKAQATQMEQYKVAREDLAPFRETGTQGMYQYADLFGIKTPNNPDGSNPFGIKAWEGYQASPFYQVPYKEGIDAMDHSAAARGDLMSSGHLKNLTKYAGDYASKQFGSFMDRLYQLAGIGSSASGATANAAMQTGQNVANSQLAQGEAKASGIIGMGNAISEGVSSLGNNLAYMGMKPSGGYPSLSANQHPIYT